MRKHKIRQGGSEIGNKPGSGEGESEVIIRFGRCSQENSIYPKLESSLP